MDTRTRRHLIDQNHISETGLTHTPRHRHCQRGCGLLLLAAINDVGIDTWLDPHPVTVAAELTALMTGRPTYTIAERELVPRDAWRISHRDADAEPAYVTHQCGTPPLEINWRHVKEIKTRPDYSAEPPF